MLTRAALTVVLVGTFSGLIGESQLGRDLTDSGADYQTTETDALTAVKLATNPTTKLAAAEDFIARFPRSNSRLQIAELVAAELKKVQDGSVAVTLIQRAQTIFTGEDEWAILKPVALDAFVKGNLVDEAFALASDMLAKNPDDLLVLATMCRAGSEEAKKRNQKYVASSLQYGLKAIALVEANKRPAALDENSWSVYKANLGPLYQQTAILYLSLSNTDEAKRRLTNATELQPHEPSNFALLGRLLNTSYIDQMKAYEAMAAGPAKQETLKRLDATLDTIIDLYAQATGLATGRPEYRGLLQQIIPDLTSYYKYRHNQSTDGLQQLINKYRIRPTRLD